MADATYRYVTDDVTHAPHIVNPNTGLTYCNLDLGLFPIELEDFYNLPMACERCKKGLVGLPL